MAGSIPVSDAGRARDDGGIVGRPGPVGRLVVVVVLGARGQDRRPISAAPPGGFAQRRRGVPPAAATRRCPDHLVLAGRNDWPQLLQLNTTWDGLLAALGVAPAVLSMVVLVTVFVLVATVRLLFVALCHSLYASAPHHINDYRGDEEENADTDADIHTAFVLLFHGRRCVLGGI